MENLGDNFLLNYKWDLGQQASYTAEKRRKFGDKEKRWDEKGFFLFSAFLSFYLGKL